MATVQMRVLDEARGMPLVVEPGDVRTADALIEWIHAQRALFDDKVVHHGAVLFRGWEVFDAPTFERVARALDPHLKNDYLGTSPRDGLTEYVFSASELPPYYPIPQHCEMSFTKTPPNRLFFCALSPNTPPGGETPLVDFRRVYRDLDPEVRARFEAKGVTNIRNYVGPEGGSKFDLWKLKRWDEMFQTTDKDVVAKRCAEEGFEATWTPSGQLRLVNTQPAVKAHPQTGEPTWYNHSQVFHLSAAAGEYKRIVKRTGITKFRFLRRFSQVMVGLKRLTTESADQAMHCTYGDGSPIPDADMEKVRDAIWKNMVAYSWQRGDVVAIDNNAVSHGRMPYEGPRTVAVAWA